jgi:hypothetical protein
MRYLIVCLTVLKVSSSRPGDDTISLRSATPDRRTAACWPADQGAPTAMACRISAPAVALRNDADVRVRASAIMPSPTA